MLVEYAERVKCGVFQTIAPAIVGAILVANNTAKPSRCYL